MQFREGHPVHHRTCTIAPSNLGRWSDDGMVRQCDGGGGTTRWRLRRYSNVSRAIVIAPSHHRYRVIALSSFWHMRCFFLSAHFTYVNKGKLDHSLFHETLIFLTYCCKIIKKVSNAFYFSVDINLNKLVLWMQEIIPRRWRGKLSYVYIKGWFYYHDSVLVASI